MGESPFQIPGLDFGGTGNKIIHFAHANGFPPATYKQLIRPFLDHYKVLAIQQRPLWENSNHHQLKSWKKLVEDLIIFLDQQKLKGVIGMGHSMGGVVSILAAIKRPDLFSKLVLLDPVLFPARAMAFTNLLPVDWRKKIIPIAKFALKRRDSWPDKQTVFDSYRKKRVFKRLSDSALWDYIEAAIKADGPEKVTLAYSKEWEAQIFVTAVSAINQLKKLRIPIIAVKGASSDVITAAVWEAWKKAQPHNQFLELPDSGHLVPMEYPEKVADWVLDKLGEEK